jgi:hypothetical protein
LKGLENKNRSKTIHEDTRRKTTKGHRFVFLRLFSWTALTLPQAGNAEVMYGEKAEEGKHEQPFDASSDARRGAVAAGVRVPRRRQRDGRRRRTG